MGPKKWNMSSFPRRLRSSKYWHVTPSYHDHVPNPFLQVDPLPGLASMTVSWTCWPVSWLLSANSAQTSSQPNSFHLLSFGALTDWDAYCVVHWKFRIADRSADVCQFWSNSFLLDLCTGRLLVAVYWKLKNTDHVNETVCFRTYLIRYEITKNTVYKHEFWKQEEKI